MSNIVWLNGEISSLENAKITVADHAYLYGDGLFEGIRIYHRKIFKLQEHLDRLYCGIRFLGFKMHLTLQELHKIILEVCQKTDIDNGYIRLNITRGTGLGLDPKYIEEKPNIMILISNLQLYDEECYRCGLKLATTTQRVIPTDCLDARVKSIGRYAVNILAKIAASKTGADEGLMLNHQGFVAECTAANLFIIHNNILSTPHPSSGILEGITRNTVIQIAKKEGFKVKEDWITPYQIFEADEVFLTGTAAGIVPIVQLDQKLIGKGQPGTITQKLTKLYEQCTQQGTPF